jgi:hypothetical protein
MIGVNRLLHIVEILERCQTGSEKDAIVDAAAKAAFDLFSICSSGEKTSILKRWLDEKHSKHQEYKCKGRIISLGTVFQLVTDNVVDEEDQGFQSQILARLQDFILGTWPIETKIFAMVSLSLTLRHLDFSQVDLQQVLTAALRDYTIDQRGDVGSNLRLEGIKAMSVIVNLGWDSKVLVSRIHRPMQEVAKQAAEKLDKIRYQAWLCLEGYWKTQQDFPALARNYPHLADISSKLYYRQLLDLLEVDPLQTPLIEGMVSSATAGTEVLGVTSRGAILEYIQDQPKEAQTDVSMTFVTVLTKRLKTPGNDDRVMIPTMELLAFLIEQVTSARQPSETQHRYLEVLEAVQTTQGPSSSLQKVEAAMQVYCSLTTVPGTKMRALDRLTRLLLHRYPKVRLASFDSPFNTSAKLNVQVRNAAADGLFLYTSVEDIIDLDWTKSAAELKPVVKTLRKTLGVM